MTQQSTRFVGSIPEHYDAFLGPRIFDGFGADLARRTAAAEPGSVLELAAGTGIVSRHLRDALPSHSSLVASDLNPPMLDIAKQKFEPHENVRLETADATDLHYGAAEFDAVVCQFGVMFFPDKLRAYQEVLRVLKPKGTYFFNVWGSWEQNAFARIAHEAVASFFPQDPPGFYKVPFGYNDIDQIERSLLQAGFGSVSIQSLRLTSPVGSSREFATGLVFGNPLFDEVLNRGGDPDQVCSAVAGAIDENLGESMPLEAIVIEASR